MQPDHSDKRRAFPDTVEYIHSSDVEAPRHHDKARTSAPSGSPAKLQQNNVEFRVAPAEIQARIRQPVRKIHQTIAMQSPVNAAIASRLIPIGTSAMSKNAQRNPEIK